MWVAIIIAVIALLMVAFMPKPNIENARAAKLGDFNVPRAKHGDPAPLIWGRYRQRSPICLWIGALRAVPITKKVSTGLFSSKRVTTGYQYYLGIDLLLCLGPGSSANPPVHLRRIWAGKHLIWTGDASTVTGININLPELFGGKEERGGMVGTIRYYPGTNNLPQNAWLQSVLDPDVPAYNGMVRAVFEDFYFGTSTSIEMPSFELEYQPTSLDEDTAIMPNGADLNPMQLCYDALTTRWGRFGNNPNVIDTDSWVACAQTLYDEGMGMSLAVQSAITGGDMLEEVMRQADGLLYQDPSTGKIVAKLIRQDYDVEDLMVLDESIVRDISNFSKTTWENTFNQCRVQFKDRATEYEDSVALAQDFANINFQNRVKSTDISAPGCMDADVANMLAARQLSFLSIPLYKCELICNRKASVLRPGDVFVLSWGPFNITRMVMRISKIDYGTLENGEVKITCVQDRYASSAPLFGAPEGSGWVPPTMDPAAVTTRDIFAAPYFLGQLGEAPSAFNSLGRMYVLAEAPGNASMDFDAMYSTATGFGDGGRVVLEDAPYCGSGTLTAAYSNTAGGTSYHDTVGFTVAGVSAAERALLVNNTTLTAARDGSSLLKINDEWLIYIGFVDHGDGTVTFPNVYRAVMDSTRGNHAMGDRVWFVSAKDGLIEQLVANTGNHYIRLIDQSPDARLPLASAPSVTVAMSNRMARPLPPDYLTLNGSRAPSAATGATSISVQWRRRSRLFNELHVYDDSDVTPESNVRTRVRWRVGTGSYTTVNTTGDSTNLNVTGLTGTLEVIVDSEDTDNGLFSLTTETLTMTLN